MGNVRQSRDAVVNCLMYFRPVHIKLGSYTGGRVPIIIGSGLNRMLLVLRPDIVRTRYKFLLCTNLALSTNKRVFICYDQIK